MILQNFQNWACAVPVLASAGWYNGLGFLLGTAHGQFWKFCKINDAYLIGIKSYTYFLLPFQNPWRSDHNWYIYIVTYCLPHVFRKKILPNSQNFVNQLKSVFLLICPWFFVKTIRLMSWKHVVSSLEILVPICKVFLRRHRFAAFGIL